MLWSFFGIVLLIQSGSNLVTLIEFFLLRHKKKFPLLLHMRCTSLYFILFIYLFFR